MKRKTLRYVLILAIFSLAGIITIQTYWFFKAFDLREKQFNQTVNIALRSVSDQMLSYINRPIPQINPVEQLSSNYFVVMLNDQIDAQLLETLLVNEFHKRNIATDFEYGIYDCVNTEMVYGNYISISDSSYHKSKIETNLPVWKDNDYYFGVLFPTKNNTLLGQMRIWVFSSTVLLIVVLFFGYALFIIFKQRRLSETQKQFINNMTHEFRTPISTILISSEVLQNAKITSDIERLHNYARIIKDESNNLLNQVENILQATIIEENKAPIKLEELNAHELIANVLERFEVRISKNELQLNLNASNPMVAADSIHFFNAIKNIIDNALKYSDGKPQISISTYDSGENLIIEIADNGIGIEPAYQKKVFDKFYRIPTGNRHDAKGFGIGLHYVKNIIKLHKGKISLESDPGKGSKFILKIPSIHEK